MKQIFKFSLEDSVAPPEVFSRRRHLFLLLIVLIILMGIFKVLDYYSILKISNLKQNLVGTISLGMKNMVAGSKSAGNFDLSSATNDFQAASANFATAGAELKRLDELIFLLASLSKNQEYRLASQAPQIIHAGELSADLGVNLSQAIGALSTSSMDFKSFLDYGQKSLADAKDLQAQLKKINPKYLPDNAKDTFLELQHTADLLVADLGNFLTMCQVAGKVIGLERDQRYLLIFQNNNELRASGGFIGSYALVDFHDGKLAKIEVPKGGTYDTEGGLQVLVKAPLALRLVNPLWHFWDANWWPDFPTTAKNLMWFYEHSSGPSVDGVIAINSAFFEDFLAVYGPIDLQKDYGTTITADNFFDVVQGIVEKPDDKQAPKKIIGDMFGKITAELPAKINSQSLLAFFGVLENNLRSKQILFYLKDRESQSFLESRNFSGSQYNLAGDYLMVVNSNIAGQKTDRMINQDIILKPRIDELGNVSDSLTIIRKHLGKKGDQFTGVRNVNWFRVYVPKGSKLLSASGFNAPDPSYFKDTTPDPNWQDNELVKQGEGSGYYVGDTLVYDEGNYTVFANWSMVDPGAEVRIDLAYELPGNILKLQPQDHSLFSAWNTWVLPQKVQKSIDYALLIQKQPGIVNANVYFQPSFPPNFKMQLSYPTSTETIGITQTSDLYFHYLMLQ